MKKASVKDLMRTIIGMIILLIVIALLFLKAYKEGQDTKYDKLFLAKDIAMFVDSIYASPNELVIKYPQNTYDYSYKFEESKITVFKKSESEILGQSYIFSEEKNIKFEYKTINTSTEESEDELIINSEEGNVPLIFVKNSNEIIPTSKMHIEDFFES
jgi:hypothetical protein